MRNPHLLAHYSCVAFYRRRLPHLDEAERPIFLTWRLHGSLPPHRPFPDTLSSGQAFANMDRLLDQTRSGPFYRRQPELAEMVVNAIHYSATVLGHCSLHAYVVMPNHVHLLVSPAVALCRLTKSLKGITAKRANAMLALTGSPFWQEEGYDHLVRHAGEFDKIRCYIEEIPFARDWLKLPASIRGRVRDGRPGGRQRTRGSAPQSHSRSTGDTGARLWYFAVKESAMFDWLVRLWRRLERWMHAEKVAPHTYHRSNLHGRHR